MDYHWANLFKALLISCVSQTIIMKINFKTFITGLLALLAILLVMGLITNLLGNAILSNRLFFAASISFPFALAAKGMEYMINDQMFKALLSIILLSLVCVLSIIFVFV